MDARPWTRTRLVVLGVLSVLLLSCDPGVEEAAERDVNNAAADVPKVCGNTEPGPEAAPAGAVTVDADDDLGVATDENPPGTTFWLAPGDHTLGDGQYSSVTPKDGNTYLGAPGAVLDGRERNKYAFVSHGSDVTVAHLTIRRFVAPVNEGVVNHDSGDGWVIEHNTIEHNGGAGMMAGARQRIRGNCLRENGQYAINAYKNGPIGDLVVEGNEIVGNNTDDWEARIEGCGCTGGVKFWAVDGVDIRDNWVHDNRGTGIWADTNNNDFLIEHNLIEDNDGPAIFYEISYNAVIRDNTIRRNNIVEGRRFADRGDSFPSASVYLSESGGEPRIEARTGKIEIYRNVLTDNWAGITLWENADRFCNSPSNTSGGCTLVVPEMEACSPPNITKDPLFDDCRWKTQNVDIHDNRFVVEPRSIGCDSLCARMAVISNFGTYPAWSPYQGDAVQQSITFNQHNTWRDNHYSGPWTFMAQDTGKVVQPPQWQSPPYSQDQGSTFVQAGG